METEERTEGRTNGRMNARASNTTRVECLIQLISILLKCVIPAVLSTISISIQHYSSQRRRKQIPNGQLETNKLTIICVISSGQPSALLLNCLHIYLLGLQHTAFLGTTVLTSFHQVKFLGFQLLVYASDCRSCPRQTSTAAATVECLGTGGCVVES